MKRSLKTNAIILKRANVNEADRLITIFSETAGKLTVKARAVRRPLSKLAGGLELLYLSQFHLVQGNSSYTVAEAVPIKVYPAIHRDLKRTELGFFCAEVVNRLTEEGIANKPIFNLLEQALDFIERSGEPRELFAGWFLLNFLAGEGITPELKVCLFCHRPVEEGQLHWSHAQGGLLHAQHTGVDPAASKIEPKLIKLMRLMLGAAPTILPQIKSDYSLAKDFFNLIYDFFRWQTKIELKTVKNFNHSNDSSI